MILLKTCISAVCSLLDLIPLLLHAEVYAFSSDAMSPSVVCRYMDGAPFNKLADRALTSSVISGHLTVPVLVVGTPGDGEGFLGLVTP